MQTVSSSGHRETFSSSTRRQVICRRLAHQVIGRRLAHQAIRRRLARQIIGRALAHQVIARPLAHHVIWRPLAHQVTRRPETGISSGHMLTVSSSVNEIRRQHTRELTGPQKTSHKLPCVLILYERSGTRSVSGCELRRHLHSLSYICSVSTHTGECTDL